MRQLFIKVIIYEFFFQIMLEEGKEKREGNNIQIRILTG